MNKALQLHAHYSQLFQAFSILPPNDIQTELLEHARGLWLDNSWREFGAFLERIEAYLTASNLSSNRRDTIEDFIKKQKRYYEQGIEIPEERPHVNQHDEEDLRERRALLAGGGHSKGDAYRWSEAEKAGVSLDRKEDLKSHLKKVDDWLSLLASRRNDTLKQVKQSAVSRTEEEEEDAFYLRWHEFRNVVDISYSKLSDDVRIKVYNPAFPQDNVTGEGLWCPILTNEPVVENWLSYSNEKRDAIRLGFMRGLCKAVDAQHPPGLFDWHALKAEFFHSIFQQNINLIAELALRTKNYAEGRARLEALLVTVYEGGQHVPHHPDFERAFFNQIRQQHSHSVVLFLEKLCNEHELTTQKDYEYLLKLLMNTWKRHDLGDSHVLAPAATWLCAQIAASTGEDYGKPIMFSKLSASENENKRLKQLLEKERASPPVQSLVSPSAKTKIPTANSPAVTVATLCQLPFTPVDLQELLQYLGLLDLNGNNLTTELQSRNRSQWGKFTAAYRVLQRKSLMSATASDIEWATAFKIAYKAELGLDVRRHSLTPQGRGHNSTPKAFREGVEKATFWVTSWVEWRGTGEDRPTKPFIAP